MQQMIEESFMDEKFPVPDAAAKSVVLWREVLNNGEPINWGYWKQLKNITSIQAAKLAHLIDPILWPDDRYAAGKIPDELYIKIQRLELQLNYASLIWDLVSLVKFLGVDDAPIGMQQVIEVIDVSNNPNTHESAQEVIALYQSKNEKVLANA